MGGGSNIQRKVHEANARHIACIVLQQMGARPHDNDIVKAVHYPLDGLDNVKLIRAIINHCFPSPSLSKVDKPWVIESVVLEALAREYLQMEDYEACAVKH